MKKLILMRHAHANKSLAVSDIQAEITAMGKRQAETIGKLINQWQIEEVLVSPAKRSIATLEILLNYFEPKNINQSRKIYEGDLTDLLHLISGTPDSASNLMLVGHNPTIYHLVLDLAQNNTELYTNIEEDGISTAELVVLEFPEANSWKGLQKNTGNIIHLFNPNVN